MSRLNCQQESLAKMARTARTKAIRHQRCGDDLPHCYQERMLLPPQASSLEEAVATRPGPGVQHRELSCTEVLLGKISAVMLKRSFLHI